jgi:hypothetical protein
MIRTRSSIGGILAFALVGAALAGSGAQDAVAGADPQVSVTSAEAPAGGEVTVSIEGDSGDAAIGAFTIDLVYDPSVAVARECTTSHGLCEPAINASTARVAGISLGGLMGHIEFVDITFDVVGTAGAVTVLDVQVIELADLDSKDLLPRTEVTDGEIRVSSSPAAALKGDADCDGQISSLDALAILRDVAGSGEAGCGQAADVDCDGELSSVDSLRVLRYVASLPVNTPDGCTPIGESS